MAAKPSSRLKATVSMNLETVSFPPTLLPFDRPQEALKICFDQMKFDDWRENMQGLESFVRLARHHRELLENEMLNACASLTHCVLNKRSQVTYAACQAVPELFSIKSKSLEAECNDLLSALLLRTADTNKFIRQEVNQAMKTMVENFSTSKLLNIIGTKAGKHQNPLVRTTGARLLISLAERLGVQRIYAMKPEQRNKFFLIGANFLEEGLLETRELAKNLFTLLSKNPQYRQLLIKVIPVPQYRNIEKIINSLK